MSKLIDKKNRIKNTEKLLKKFSSFFMPKTVCSVCYVFYILFEKFVKNILNNFDKNHFKNHPNSFILAENR